MPCSQTLVCAGEYCSRRGAGAVFLALGKPEPEHNQAVGEFPVQSSPVCLSDWEPNHNMLLLSPLPVVNGGFNAVCAGSCSNGDR